MTRLSSTIDRRSAIQGIATLLAAGLLRPRDALAMSAMPNHITLGLALFTVREPAARDFEGTLGEVSTIGYHSVDMYIYMSGKPPAETRAMLDRTNLTCRSARVATPALYRGWERFLDAANVLGARWITLANVSPEERLGMRDWHELADVFNRAGAAARRAGLTVCYHNHAFEYEPLEGKTPLDVLLASTDPELVKLQLDVYWAARAGRDPVAEIRRLGTRVASLHLKDMDATPARGITTAGRGILDFGAIMRAAAGFAATDWFVEEDNPREPMAAVRESFRHLAPLAP